MTRKALTQFLKHILRMELDGEFRILSVYGPTGSTPIQADNPNRVSDSRFAQNYRPPAHNKNSEPMSAALPGALCKQRA